MVSYLMAAFSDVCVCQCLSVISYWNCMRKWYFQNCSQNLAAKLKEFRRSRYSLHFIIIRFGCLGLLAMDIENTSLLNDLECMPYIVSNLYLLVRNDQISHVISDTDRSSQDEECPRYAISLYTYPRESISDESYSGISIPKSNVVRWSWLSRCFYWILCKTSIC